MKLLLSTGALVYSLVAVQGRSLGEVNNDHGNHDMTKENSNHSNSWDMADVVDQVMHEQHVKEAFEHWKDTALFDKEEDKYLPGGHKGHGGHKDRDHDKHRGEESDSDSDSDCDSDSEYSDSDDDDEYNNVIVTRVDNSFVYIKPIVNENQIVISNDNSGNNDIENNNFVSWSAGHGKTMEMEWMEKVKHMMMEEGGKNKHHSSTSPSETMTDSMDEDTDSASDCDDENNKDPKPKPEKRPSKNDHHPGFDTPSWSPSLPKVDRETPSYNCVTCLFDEDSQDQGASPVETPEPTVDESVVETPEPTVIEEETEQEGSESDSVNIDDLPF